MHLHPGKKVWWHYRGKWYAGRIVKVSDTGLCRPVVTFKADDTGHQFPVNASDLSERNEE